VSVIKDERVIWVDHPGAGKIPVLPLPHSHGTAYVGGILERADHYFVSLDRATDEDFRSAAELARRRILRCKLGSDRWWWYTCVIFTQERPRLHLVPTDGGAR